MALDTFWVDRPFMLLADLFGEKVGVKCNVTERVTLDLFCRCLANCVLVDVFSPRSLDQCTIRHFF